MLSGNSENTAVPFAPGSPIPIPLISAFALIAILLLSGCTTTGAVRQINKLDTVSENARFLIMTPDVKYYLLTAGGVPQPRAEWTEAARINFSRALQNYTAERDIEIVALPDQEQLTELETDYQKLYSAVGSTVLSHYYGPIKLPTKKGVFDWSMGPGVQAIGAKYGADYALFSFYRDYEASGGRIALSFFGALMGVGIVTGGEVGYASLIDLRTGDIVWFNRVTTGVGELRHEATARATVDALFEDLPSAQSD